MAKKIYYGVMTTVIEMGPYGEFWHVDPIYSSPEEKQPDDVSRIKDIETTLKEWYKSERLAKKALELRKKTILKMEQAGESISKKIFQEVFLSGECYGNGLEKNW